MIDNILKKMGFSSVEEFIQKENEIDAEYEGTEIERTGGPLSLLTIDEIYILQDYCQKHNLA